jgi:hypothetical protein
MLDTVAGLFAQVHVAADGDRVAVAAVRCGPSATGPSCGGHNSTVVFAAGAASPMMYVDRTAGKVFLQTWKPGRVPVVTMR